MNLNIWASIFSNLLYFIFDSKFKFIDVIESFTSYDKLTSTKLKDLNNCKKQLEKLILEEVLDFIEIKLIFITIARIIAPDLESAESEDLLDKVFNQPIELSSYKPVNSNELNILTLHKSKGLEYDVIIHIDLYEWVLPNKKPGPNDDFKNPVFGDWQQDLNLHYVGLTRAKKGCILVTSTQRTNNKGQVKNGNDSEFLNHNGIQELRRNKK